MKTRSNPSRQGLGACLVQLACVFLVALSGAGCAGQGTSTGNPLVALSLQGYANPASVPSAKVGDVVPSAVSPLTLCFKRVRFKQAGEETTEDPSLDEDNVDFNLGEVSIDASGTPLQSVAVPPGTYTRVEFDLENHCASGKSVALTNSHDSFTSTDRITIRFDGSFQHDNSDKALALDLQQIINALDAVTSDAEIKTRAEGVSGGL
ncbi:MAG: hypothetical protein NDI61_03960 [Bdellovibrionaceae bacterium]|nr:hypothetical protein [Pseudobdellovibrionaceae bacterium]